jgi:glycine cleavage system regulatory protein
MNANELADLLEVDSWYKLVTREEIAAMLRQQQAEIEALKEQLTQITAEDKKLFEAVQRANDVWDKATGRKP